MLIDLLTKRRSKNQPVQPSSTDMDICTALELQTPQTPSGTEDVQFDRDFRDALIALEKKLHSETNLEVVTKETIKATCLFHDADWCGILIADYGTGVFSPAVWFERSTGGMTPTLFHENEFFENYPRWVDALSSGEPIIIEDIETLKETNPDEYLHYRRLAAHSIIGTPFGERPTGFLVVRNPKKYKAFPDFVKI